MESKRSTESFSVSYFKRSILKSPILTIVFFSECRGDESYMKGKIYLHEKIDTVMITWVKCFIKVITSKYWEELSKSDSLTASLSLAVMTFSMELLFLVKALNLIVLPWIVEWNHYHLVLRRDIISLGRLSNTILCYH